LDIKHIADADKLKKICDNLGAFQPFDFGPYDCRRMQFNKLVNKKRLVTSWATVVGDALIIFSIGYKKERDKEIVAGKVDLGRRIIESFLLYTDDERDKRVTSFRFEMFLQGVGAAGHLFQRSMKNHAFIEAICLIANLIDSLLRLAIVYKIQLNKGNDLIEREWIYQGTDDKKKSEKDIYKKSLELGVLSKELFDELYELYDDRNRVVHRFIISEIRLTEVEEITFDYVRIMRQCSQIISDLETEQLQRGVGMVTEDEEEKGNKSPHLNFITGKIGNLDYLIDQTD
jgi:hypothetical protein